MTKNVILITLTLIVLLVACRKDSEGTESVTIIPEIPTYLQSIILGKVETPNHTGLPNAAVTINESTVLTDAFGYFQLVEQQKSDGSLHTQATLQNYFEGASRVVLAEDGVNFVRLVMQPNGKILGTGASEDLNRIQVNVGGEIETKESIELSIGASTLRAVNSTTSTEEVSVLTSWLNTTPHTNQLVMPANGFAKTSKNKEVILEPYTGVVLEIVDFFDEAFQLKTNQTMRLRLPVPTELLSAAPSEIPLWYFNKKKGFWNERGAARLEGIHYVSEVDYVGNWVAALPHEITQVTGQLVAERENPVANERLLVSFPNGIQVGTTQTGEHGYFALKVPADQILDLTVANECGLESAPTKEIYTKSRIVVLGKVTFSEEQEADQYPVSVQVIDCNSIAIEDAIVEVGKTFLLSKPDGTITTNLLGCTSKGIRVQVQHNNYAQTHYYIPEQVKEGVEVPFCATNSQELIHISQGSSLLADFTAIQTNLTGVGIELFAELDAQQLHLTIPYYERSIYEGEGQSMELILNNTERFLATSSDFEVIVEGVEEGGQYAIGVFSGTLQADAVNQIRKSPITVSGAFKVRVQ